jgi:hypothetical protein
VASYSYLQIEEYVPVNQASNLKIYILLEGYLSGTDHMHNNYCCRGDQVLGKENEKIAFKK